MGRKCFVTNCDTGYRTCKKKFSLFSVPKDDILLISGEDIIKECSSGDLKETFENKPIESPDDVEHDAIIDSSEDSCDENDYGIRHYRRPERFRSINKWGAMDFDDLNFEKKPYSHLPAYGQSKLANVLFTKELARRLEEHGIQGVNVYSLHPGIIRTELGRNLNLLIPGLKFLWRTLGCWLIKTPEQGAQTTIHCSIDEKAGSETGLYYSECKVTNPHENALNENDAKKLWDVSVELTGLQDYDPFKI